MDPPASTGAAAARHAGAAAAVPVDVLSCVMSCRRASDCLVEGKTKTGNLNTQLSYGRQLQTLYYTTLKEW